MRNLPTFPIAIIMLFVIFALFADFIAPYPYDLQSRKTPYHPPTRIHIVKDGRITFPYVNPYVMEDPIFKSYRENKKVSCKIEFFTKTPYGFKLFGVKAPCKIHLLGADKLGRDVFSRLVYGARVSMFIGLVGITVTFLVGSLVGGFSGYMGGKVDSFIMRIVEVLLAIPTFYLMLSLRSVFPLTMGSFEVFLMVVFIISFIGWAGLARVIRGMVLSIREKEFVQSAKTYGAGTFRILTKHILPNTYYYLIVSATLSFPGYILGESALSFLGLGVQEPQPSWGNMLSDARNVNLISSYPWILSPGVAIFLLVMAFNLLGDELLRRQK
ncbi:binding-protein-dependent transport systems inner membrane component [Hydrogenobacter thermophilus TK-6]|uniref:Binding-protein-dependent transport systems inner membrane component n=1 Tax=Hydrogenobacter thermophilus (strain DSM 6534 / IAM 12695 / TK-6) TaxID=608538 RepID=D3DG81_HYDTT|nr:ABC transporter permease [Hydrogenobacter thermophilus]ADO44768.1 binding-protein-dependent transport systems inner membrane component [Hydrogenobacter thermophilus TK-6]BAI68833.1 binding-protein-dependent transport systems inner membrane component [Hydrogenobacter thermophilus TK-6]